MNVGDETRSKYQTSFSRYDTLKQAIKDFVAEVWLGVWTTGIGIRYSWTRYVSEVSN